MFLASVSQGESYCNMRSTGIRRRHAATSGLMLTLGSLMSSRLGGATRSDVARQRVKEAVAGLDVARHDLSLA